ncbi:WYL domain-containing protein [Aeromonas hydrophila]|uniref:WYL domain-containing protein n=1 Tax=Aeromonas hydrophila TaxID=644 RepID=UPI003EC921A2
MNANAKFFSDIFKEDQTLAIRLAYIDFKLYYTGALSRADIVSEFDVSEITATRIIAKYKEIRASNMEYDAREKRFNINLGGFLSYVDIVAEDALSMLASGFDKNKILRDRGAITFEYIVIPSPILSKENVSAITRSIFLRKKIKCIYNSVSNPARQDIERTLIPLIILHDGRNWIFRAYHEEANGNVKYKNFNFSRVKSILESNESAEAESGLIYDDLWNKFVPIELEINHKLNNDRKEEIRRNFGINADKILMTERAAFVWIILNQSRTFYKGSHSVTIDDCQFVLVNEKMLHDFGAINY